MKQLNVKEIRIIFFFNMISKGQIYNKKIYHRAYPDWVVR